jgi:probable rRNA maturation factor
MQAPSVSIDCYVNLAEQDASIQRILAADLPEQVVAHTLRAASLTQAAGHLQSYALSLIITSDDEIQALNKQYRRQDKPTDVLSFPLLDRPLVNAPTNQLWLTTQAEEDKHGKLEELHPAFITPAELATNLGDIVISWPTVARQAAQAGHPPVYELLYLLSHGILHLLGYDDQTEDGYAAMVSIQDAAMREIEWESYVG